MRTHLGKVGAQFFRCGTARALIDQSFSLSQRLFRFDTTIERHQGLRHLQLALPDVDIARMFAKYTTYLPGRT